MFKPSANIIVFIIFIIIDLCYSYYLPTCFVFLIKNLGHFPYCTYKSTLFFSRYMALHWIVIYLTSHFWLIVSKIFSVSSKANIIICISLHIWTYCYKDKFLEEEFLDQMLPNLSPKDYITLHSHQQLWECLFLCSFSKSSYQSF